MLRNVICGLGVATYVTKSPWLSEAYRDNGRVTGVGESSSGT